LNLVDRIESRVFTYISIRKPLNQKYNFYRKLMEVVENKIQV